MIMFEFLVKTREWPCIGLYKSPSQNENYSLDILSKVLSNIFMVLNAGKCHFMSQE